MTAYRKDQGLILGKMQRGEPLTQGEQMKLLSRGVDYSKGSPAVVDFSDGSSVADKVPEVGVMESGPSKGRGVGSTVASMGGSIASAAGVKAPLGAITGLASGVLDNQPLAQTVANTAWGGVKDLTGMMGPVGQLGMAAYGLFSSEDPTAAAVNLAHV